MQEVGTVFAESALLEDFDAQPRNGADKGPLAIQGFPKASNDWGFKGSRFQGPV